MTIDSPSVHYGWLSDWDALQDTTQTAIAGLDTTCAIPPPASMSCFVEESFVYGLGSPSTTPSSIGDDSSPPESAGSGSPGVETFSLLSSDSREYRKPAPSKATRAPRQRRVPCLQEGCDRYFTSNYTRAVHMRSHKPKTKQILVCDHPNCGESFSRYVVIWMIPVTSY
jgi:hypothetical protein